MSIMLSISLHKLLMVFACLLTTITPTGTLFAQTQIPAIPLQAWQPPRLPSGEISHLYDKQGYPKDKSNEMLDPQIRQLLDAALRLYREPGLFTDRKKALEVLDAQSTTRRWSSQDSVPSGYRSYTDTFAKSGIFARAAWRGEYRYSGKNEPWLNEWHEVIRINVDRKLECHNSRAVEGYLDMVLAPDGTRSPHYLGDRKRRHDVILGKTSAPALSLVTPTLLLTFSEGCLSELTIAEIFNYKDISDDNARN